jgi:hypothetical protein
VQSRPSCPNWAGFEPSGVSETSTEGAVRPICGLRRLWLGGGLRFSRSLAGSDFRSGVAALSGRCRFGEAPTLLRWHCSVSVAFAVAITTGGDKTRNRRPDPQTLPIHLSWARSDEASESPSNRWEMFALRTLRHRRVARNRRQRMSEKFTVVAFKH